MQVYVAGRLSEVELVRRVQEAVREQGHEITYDWTTHGNVRGDERALVDAATQEIEGCASADRLIVLLSNGAESRQGGLHVELGAALGAWWAYGDSGGWNPGRALVWTPPKYADIFDPAHPRTLAFYHHPWVGQLVCVRARLPARVAGWLRQA